MAQRRASQNQRGEWLTIDDFRPGIVSDYRAPVTTGTTLDLEPGTASEGTVRCCAAVSGALVPLPALSTTLTAVLPPVNLGGDAYNGVYKPVGIWSLGPMWQFTGGVGSQSATFLDEIHVTWEKVRFLNPNYARRLVWGIIKAYQPTIPTPSLVQVDGHTLGSPPALSLTRGMSHAITRARTQDFTYPGYPCVFTEWGDSPPYNTGIYAWWVWPDPTIANLGTDTPNTQTGTFDANVIFCTTVIPHQGRVILLLDSEFAHSLNGQFLSNEQFGVTDPPGNIPPTNNFATPFAPNNTPIYSLDPELPGGYGSWGSISFGELILIKKAGGALHVWGDILGTNNLITRLAGVTSTGSLVNAGSKTPIGLVYCVDGDGAYVWNGDNVSRKISRIGDRFYDRPDGNPAYGVQVRHAPWGDWVVFPNNWLYDTLTDSWWQLEDPAVYTAVMCAESMSGKRFLYTVTNDNTGQVTVFDRNQPASSYVFISQPIVLEEQLIDIFYCEVAISHNANTTGEVDVQLEQADGTFPTATVFTFNVVSTTIQRLRQPLSASRVPHIRFKVTVKNTTANQPAPVLNGIRFYWQPSGVPQGPAL